MANDDSNPHSNDEVYRKGITMGESHYNISTVVFLHNIFEGQLYSSCD